MAKNKTTKKEKLINILASGKNVSAAALAKKLGVARVSAHINNLRNEGFVIYTNTGRDGTQYRLDGARSF